MTLTPPRLLAVGLLVLASGGRTDAHALGAEAKLRGDRVTVEAYYDDDTPAERATVTVTDASGTTVAEGRTDDRGVWSFAAPPAGKYKAAVDAGAGHRTTITLTVPAQPKPQTPARPAEPPSAAAPGTAPARGLPVRPAAAEAITVSEGPTRAEFTGTGRLVWVAAGLGGIALAVGAFAVIRRHRGGANSDAVG